MPLQLYGMTVSKKIEENVPLNWSKVVSWSWLRTQNTCKLFFMEMQKL